MADMFLLTSIVVIILLLESIAIAAEPSPREVPNSKTFLV